jgi:hypothetical protein
MPKNRVLFTKGASCLPLSRSHPTDLSISARDCLPGFPAAATTPSAIRMESGNDRRSSPRTRPYDGACVLFPAPRRSRFRRPGCARRPDGARTASTRSFRRLQTKQPDKESPHANACFGFHAMRSPCRRRSSGAGATKLQGVRRTAEGMHEELCRPDLFERIPHVHEVMPVVEIIWFTIPVAVEWREHQPDGRAQAVVPDKRARRARSGNCYVGCGWR